MLASEDVSKGVLDAVVEEPEPVEHVIAQAGIGTRLASEEAELAVPDILADFAVSIVHLTLQMKTPRRETRRETCSGLSPTVTPWLTFTLRTLSDLSSMLRLAPKLLSGVRRGD
jgi:hypothetical protein